ncbi:heavy metal-binding domain-containing protein [uncultured Friedmanniella sp.]|uniref:heavy metal-binding domain-containing protein n=1 Tax=uncultured Friedmanniella sp. TaxID=335381 RepID=UPI0035C98EB6
MSNYGPPNPYQQPYAPQGGRPGQQPYQGQQPYRQPPQGYGQTAPGQPYGQQGQWTPQPPLARKPALVQHALPVVTLDQLVGHEITEVLGDVVGVVVRTRELRPDLRQGNPMDGYVTMLTESRQDAVTRLVEMAVAAGAHAVVGLRYDCSEITQSLSEVAAYGTAVKLAGAGEPSNPSA